MSAAALAGLGLTTLPATETAIVYTFTSTDGSCFVPDTFTRAVRYQHRR